MAGALGSNVCAVCGKVEGRGPTEIENSILFQRLLEIDECKEWKNFTAHAYQRNVWNANVFRRKGRDGIHWVSIAAKAKEGKFMWFIELMMVSKLFSIVITPQTFLHVRRDFKIKLMN